jgi:hypothetical protein
MAVVSALLPVAQAVAVHAGLTRAALSAKAAGDERGKGQLMADTLVELVTGQATAGDVPVEVQVVIIDPALLAGDETPAHLPGYGPVPAGWARDLLTRDLESRAAPAAAGLVGQAREATGLPPPNRHHDDRERAARVWVRRLFTHPGIGTLVAMDSSRRLFPAGLRRFVVARDGTCRTPWCDAPIAHADHVRPHVEGGPTSAANGQGLCVRCNLVKEEPGWTSVVVEPGPLMNAASTRAVDIRPHTVQVTTPTGHTYASTAPTVLPTAPISPLTARQGRPDTSSNVIRFELYRRPDVQVELAG